MENIKNNRVCKGDKLVKNLLLDRMQIVVSEEQKTSKKFVKKS